MEPKMYVVSLTPAVQRLGASIDLRGDLAGLCVFTSSQPRHQMFLTANEAANWSRDGWSVEEVAPPKPKKADKAGEEK